MTRYVGESDKQIQIDEYLDDVYYDLKRYARKNGVKVIEIESEEDDSDVADFIHNAVIMNKNFKYKDTTKVFRFAHEMSHLLKDEDRLYTSKAKNFSDDRNHPAERLANINASIFLANLYFDVANGGVYLMSKLNDFCELFGVTGLGFGELEIIFEKNGVFE